MLFYYIQHGVDPKASLLAMLFYTFKEHEHELLHIYEIIQSATLFSFFTKKKNKTNAIIDTSSGYLLNEIFIHDYVNS